MQHLSKIFLPARSLGLPIAFARAIVRMDYGSPTDRPFMSRKPRTPIARPKLDAEDPDRTIECQFVLEPDFQRLACRAEAAGWSGDEVASALVGLARAYERNRRVNEATEHQIRSARAKH